MMVAIVVGANGINALLVVSQVILSVVLPFVTFPLLYCTSSKAIMRVRKDPVGNDSQGAGDVEDGNQWVYFNNNKVAVGIGIVIWLLVVTANVYVLLSLIFGFG
jgi:metal iron transporter